jgi:D-alanyl-D-alanine carboxypeptidase
MALRSGRVLLGGLRPGRVAPSHRRLPNNRRSGPHPKTAAAPDDIPLARRSHSDPRERKSGSSRAGWIVGASTLLLLGIAGLVVFATLRSRLAPPPVVGLDAQRSRDGRLLGHFPYPEAKESSLVAIAPGMKLHPDAAESFLAMQQAAAADDVALTLLSAFRSLEVQQQLFFAVKAQRNQTSLDRAKVSAPPGFSEHSTGYAVDIGDLSEPQTNLSATFTQTKAYRWLKQNASRYHFTLSFPEANAQGVNFEPWHWRYEGSVDALRLFEPAQRLRRSAKG